MTWADLDPKDVAMRVRAAILACVYAWVLNFSYLNAESILFDYQGLVFSPPRWEFLVLGYLGAALPMLWMPMRVGKPSDVALWLTYATMLVPTLFVPYHVTSRTAEEVSMIVGGVYLSFLALCWGLRWRPVPLAPLPISERGFYWLLIGAIGATTFMVAAANGFRVELSLADVYARRMEARDTAGAGSLVGYALAWLAGSFAPLGIAYGLIKKYPSLIVAGTIGLLSIFSFSGTKSSLFTPLLMLLIFFLIRKARNSFGIVMLLGVTTAVGLSVLAWTQQRNPILSESLTRRIIISKGVSTTFYWQEFENDPMLMRDSIFARLIGLPPVTEKTFLIGSIYGRGDAENYNANAWASAFGNFGYPGLFLASLVIALVLRVVDVLARYGNPDFLTMACAYFGFVWGEQAVESSFLSSGVVVTILLLMLASGIREPAAEPLPQGVPA